MMRSGSTMAPALLLPLLIVAVSAATMEVSTASTQVCHRKTCGGEEYNTCRAVCCENQLHQGEGLSCCGGQTYNKEQATCCRARRNQEVTPGISEKMSQCCGVKAYNQVNEMCCKGNVVARPAADALCCNDVAYDVDKQLCCGPLHEREVLAKISKDHLCCKDKQYNTKTECCCETDKGLIVQSSDCANCDDSVRCEGVHYNKFHQLCCNGSVQLKNASNIECCGRQTYNTDTELCCSATNVKLRRKSPHHMCCGVNQFDKKTERCCEENGLQVQPLSSSCEEQGGAESGPAAYIHCTEPHAQVCGSSCYNPTWQSCCERTQPNSQWCLSPGRCVGTPNVYDPRTHICCNGCVSEKPSIEPQNTPAQHLCGAEPYNPQDQICCHGHRHPRNENSHCCGMKAYNIKDTRLKCCAGRLHNQTVRQEARCCGSILLTPPELKTRTQSIQNPSVCCASANMEALYSAKPRFSCCGHHYFNTSVWSCCQGRLSPVQHPGRHTSNSVQESGPMSVNNLSEAELCDEMNIGTVESVSLHSIVFINVLTINGRNGTVTPLASPHLLKTRHGCHAPKLIPGKSFFFNKDNVFTDFNHDSVLHFLTFVISKCYLLTANAN